MAVKVVEGSIKNIVNLLCNFADSKNNLITNEIEEEIQRTNDYKVKTDEAIASASLDLKRLENKKKIMEQGPEAFDKFANSFKNNQLLIDFLQNLGFVNCLKEYEEAYNQEKKTNRIKNKIATNLENIKCELKQLEFSSLRYVESLKNSSEMLRSVNSALADLKYLIEASIDGNGSINKDYIERILDPIIQAANRIRLILPKDFVKKAEMILFFPEDEGLKAIYEKSKGNEDSVRINFVNEEIQSEKIPNNDLNNDSIDLVGEEIEDETISSYEEDSFENPLKEEMPEEETVIEEQIDDITQSEDVEEEPTFVEEDEDVKNLLNDNHEEEQATTGDVEENVQTFVKEPEEVNIENEAEEIESVDVSEAEETGEIVAENEEKYEEGNLASSIIEEMSDELSSETYYYGLDENRMSEELKKLLIDSDSKVIENNIDTLKALNVDDDMLYYEKDGYSYLTDKDLSSKINILRSKGISEKAIANSVELFYITCSLESIKEGINSLENSDLKYDSHYLPILNIGIDKFLDSLSQLRKSGIEPDESEIAAYLPILAKYHENVKPILKIYKKYGVSFLKKNGKYDLSVFVKSPFEVLKSVNDLIENGQEELINGNPEILSFNTDTIIRRILYLENANTSYKSSDGVYADFVVKPMLFVKDFGHPQLIDFPSTKECNDELVNSMGDDMTSIYRELLDNYYATDKLFEPIELYQEEKAVFDELKAYFENELGAKLVSKNAYEMNGMLISRNKFEKNLSLLVSTLVPNGEDLVSQAREVLMTAALYNTRRPSGKVIEMPMKEDTSRFGGMVA